MEKKLIGKLKVVPEAMIVLSDLIDFNANWVQSSAIIEESKRRLLSKLKLEMHEKISVMTLEDIEFKILP